MTTRLVWEEHLQSSPIALEFIVRGWTELKNRGFSDGRLSIHPAMQAIVGYAMNGREELPVGVLVFEYDAAQKRVWIPMGYVLEEFRGQGIYTKMWNGLVAQARELGVRTIEGATHVRNTAMRAVAKKQGREELFVITVYNLLAD